MYFYLLMKIIKNVKCLKNAEKIKHTQIYTKQTKELILTRIDSFNRTKKD